MSEMDEDEHIDSQSENGGSSEWKPQDERIGCMGCLLPIKTSDRYNRKTYWLCLGLAVIMTGVTLFLPLLILLTMGGS